MSFIGLSTNVSLMAVLNVGGGLIATGELTAGSLTQFAMQVHADYENSNYGVSGISSLWNYFLDFSWFACYTIFLYGK